MTQRRFRGVSQLFKATSTSLVPTHRTEDAPWTSAFWLRRDHSVWSRTPSWEAGVKGFLWQSWGWNSEWGPCKHSNPEPCPSQSSALPSRCARTHAGETEEREMSNQAASQQCPFCGKLPSKVSQHPLRLRNIQFHNPIPASMSHPTPPTIGPVGE